MLGYIKERMEVLSHECHAHRELTGKRQQLVSSFEELVDKVTFVPISVCSWYLDLIIILIINEGDNNWGWMSWNVFFFFFGKLIIIIIKKCKLCKVFTLWLYLLFLFILIKNKLSAIIYHYYLLIIITFNYAN